MPRWMRVVRGMVGTGLTFAAGVGAVSSVVGLAALFAGKLSGHDLMEIVGKLSVVSFIVGVAFSAFLAIAARGRTFDKLSFRFVTTLGTGVGLLYFLFTAINGFRVWTTSDAIANLSILTLMGGGLAAGTLFLARKAGRALNSGTELHRLSEATVDATFVRREQAQHSHSRPT